MEIANNDISGNTIDIDCSNIGNVGNITADTVNINIQSYGILSEFISYMNALPLEKQVKIMQFALKQKNN
ncbi:MAG: hypothetical protein J6B74_00955 [Ruminococcus sp.]|nr:hypothetical protein [Ruminococcus sp.]